MSSNDCHATFASSFNEHWSTNTEISTSRNSCLKRSRKREIEKHFIHEPYLSIYSMQRCSPQMIDVKFFVYYVNHRLCSKCFPASRHSYRRLNCLPTREIRKLCVLHANENQVFPVRWTVHFRAKWYKKKQRDRRKWTEENENTNNIPKKMKMHRKWN